MKTVGVNALEAVSVHRIADAPIRNIPITLVLTRSEPDVTLRAIYPLQLSSRPDVHHGGTEARRENLPPPDAGCLERKPFNSPRVLTGRGIEITERNLTRGLLLHP